MSRGNLIKFLPIIGVAIGLWIGEETRTGFIMSEIPWADLIDGLFNRSPGDQELAKQQLIHIGTYGLVGGGLAFLMSVFLKKQEPKGGQ